MRVFAILLLLATAAVSAQSVTRKFYPDDPIAREPDSQDASGAGAWDIGLLYDLSFGLFVTGTRPPSGMRAQNVNTIDEVPDSSWFVNRIGARSLSAAEILREAAPGKPPADAEWTIIREKSSGFAPGFTAKDAAGETWFISFDPPSNPEAATGAMLVANRIFWALGYYQVETFLTTIDRAKLHIDPKATMRRPSGARTPMTTADLDAIFERAARRPDGRYRAAAGRLLPGKILGGFRYAGTRPDDPNDIVPHEHRRELRALRVFGAWTNLTDMKAGNTLDTLLQENGRGLVRHYLQDVGSTFGMGANGPHDPDEGWEYLYEGRTTRNRLLSFGFWQSPWQRLDYRFEPELGKIEAEKFDPVTWKPRAPTAAYMEMRADDAFWAARRVMAFDNELIRALVAAGEYTNNDAAAYLSEMIAARRDKIGRTYYTSVNPIVDLSLDSANRLTFENAAVKSGFAPPPAGYRASWFQFDNLTRETKAIGESESQTASMAAPAGLPQTAGAFLKVEVSADGTEQKAWERPVDVYFVRQSNGWKLVGLERLP